MTHSEFLPIARRELQKLGFAIEEIPPRASSQQNTPDFSMIGKSSCYLVELKVKGDDPAEIERNRRDLKSGKVVMKSAPTSPRNRMDAIICEGSGQMADEDPAHAKFGSPGIAWAFFIGWFERGGKKTELLG